MVSTPKYFFYSSRVLQDLIQPLLEGQTTGKFIRKPMHTFALVQESWMQYYRVEAAAKESGDFPGNIFFKI